MNSSVKIIEQTAEFIASGRPSLIRIHGHSQDHQESLTLENDSLDGTISVALESFETGMRFKDSHLYQQVFDSGHFPRSTMKLKKLSIQDQRFKGALDFHGMEKEILGTQEFKKTADGWSYRIEFSVDMTEFGIKPPEFMGMRIKPEVKVTVTGKLQ